MDTWIDRFKGLSTLPSEIRDRLAKSLFSVKPAATRGAAQAFGSYSKGCLAGGKQLAETGPTWQAMRLSRNRNWGHPDLVDFVQVSPDSEDDGQDREAAERRHVRCCFPEPWRSDRVWLAEGKHQISVDGHHRRRLERKSDGGEGRIGGQRQSDDRNHRSRALVAGLGDHAPRQPRCP